MLASEIEFEQDVQEERSDRAFAITVTAGAFILCMFGMMATMVRRCKNGEGIRKNRKGTYAVPQRD